MSINERGWMFGRDAAIELEIPAWKAMKLIEAYETAKSDGQPDIGKAISPEQPDGSPFDSACMPDHKTLAAEIVRFVDETEKHDFLDKDHLHRTIQDAVWIALECAKSYGVSEGWKRGSATKREFVDLERIALAIFNARMDATVAYEGWLRFHDNYRSPYRREASAAMGAAFIKGSAHGNTWKRIDTAPKDGSRFLAIRIATKSYPHPTWDFPQVCYWRDGSFRRSSWATCHSEDDDPFRFPTHWIPLFPLPTTEIEDERPVPPASAI